MVKKVQGTLTCPCGASVPNNCKYRRRFRRRHPDPPEEGHVDRTRMRRERAIRKKQEETA